MRDKFPLPVGTLFYLILALFLAGGTLMYFMPVEETVVARGFVDFTGQAYAVSATAGGTVRAVHAGNGTTVAAGAPLLSVGVMSDDAREIQVNIPAPDAGILLWQRDIIRGDMVQRGERLAVVYPPEPVGVTVMLPDRDMGRVVPGMPVRIKIDAYPYQRFGTLEGVVQGYNMPGGPERHLVLTVEIKEIPQSMTLLPGMKTGVDIITGRDRMLRRLF